MTSLATANETAGTRAAAEAGPRKISPWILLAPASLVMAVLLVCTLVLFRISLGRKNAEWTDWTTESYLALIDPVWLGILFQTIWLAALSAALTVVVAFPIAVTIARTRSALVRRALLVAIMLPMLVSLLVQSYGWMVILGPGGALDSVWRLLPGESRAPMLLFNRTGVLLGLVQTALPLAVLPLVSSLRAVSPVLEEAAAVLGAARPAVYREIILPLARPGIVGGAILVFGFNTGAFVVPLLLGGLKVTTAAIVIRDQMGPLLDWPLGAAFAIVLIALAVLTQLGSALFAGKGAR